MIKQDPGYADLNIDYINENRDNTTKYVSVVDDDVNIYRFLLDAYEYSGGFRTGKYLVRFPIEGYYDDRRDFSHYVNFYGSIVDAMVTPVFADAPKREIKNGNDERWNGFVKDCSSNGVTLNDFMKDRVASIARACSVVFTVMENFPIDMQPETIPQALDNRIYPYIYNKTPDQVGWFKLDTVGRLVEISFYDKTVEINGVDEQLYRVWNDIESRLVYIKTIDGKKTVVDYEEPVLHMLGVVPVVITTDTPPKNSETIFPEPRLYGVGRVAHALFNKDSEMREFERKAAFSMLAIQGDKSEGDQTLGQGNIIYYPVESSNAPEWISPDPNLVKELRENRNALREDLYGIAEQAGVTAVRDAKSGIALAYEFQAHKFILDETATICDTTEMRLFDLFMRYTGNYGAYEYHVTYNREFLPYNVKEVMDHDSFLLEIPEIPRVFKDSIIMDHYRTRFPEASQEEIDDVQAALDERAVIESQIGLTDAQED